MKAAKKIEQLVGKFCATTKSYTRTSSEMNERVLSDALSAYEKSVTSEPALAGTSVRRIIMKSRITKLATAAVIAIAAGIGIHYFTRGGTSLAYGMTDVPALLRSARTLHSQSTYWRYCDNPDLPEFAQAIVIPSENWVDVPNMREHRIGFQSWSRPNGEKGLNKIEGFRDRDLAMDIDHTRKTVRYNKCSLIKRKLAMRRIIQERLHMISEEELDSFVKVGQETINGTMFDIWEREDAEGRDGQPPKKVRCWLAPATGELGRIYTWRKSKMHEGLWQPFCFIDKIERDVDIPASIFDFKAPENYDYRNTIETAFVGEGLGGGFYFMGRARVSLAISFTLDDGSVIVAWHSDDLQADRYQEQDHLFKGLQQGGELPKLPMVLYGLKKVPRKPNSESEAYYVGRHLGFTKKARWHYEWALYVPERQMPAATDGGVYRMLCSFNLPSEQEPEVGNPIPLNKIEKDEFDMFVRGAMAELSDDGKAPQDITYENVLRLARQIRQSLAE